MKDMNMMLKPRCHIIPIYIYSRELARKDLNIAYTNSYINLHQYALQTISSRHRIVNEFDYNKDLLIMGNLNIQTPSPSIFFKSKNILVKDNIFLSLNCVLNGQPDMIDRNNQNINNEKIQKTYQILHDHLPRFFQETHPFNIYHTNIIFENNIKGFTLHGKNKYISWLYWLKLINKLKYAEVKLNILKMTLHTESRTIKIRWQLTGISNISAFFKIWKKDRFDIVKDGFSTFFLDSNGLVIKHLMDKMMMDEDYKLSTGANIKANIVSSVKTAFLAGLVWPIPPNVSSMLDD
ncbi:unnamed protein product [Gordionus sp. m RMFG-2023]|uniref:uncharacterized protein LOC135931869 n=1 Tax=Gordionus sp. m RMFG-2023 TaxID=3053472 RepID=UPI0030DE0773